MGDQLDGRGRPVGGGDWPGLAVLVCSCGQLMLPMVVDADDGGPSQPIIESRERLQDCAAPAIHVAGGLSPQVEARDRLELLDREAAAAGLLFDRLERYGCPACNRLANVASFFARTPEPAKGA